MRRTRPTPRTKPRTVAMKLFGERMRSVRHLSNYDSAEDFAKELGIEAPRYRTYERGESFPPLQVLIDVKRLTDCSLDWLLIGGKAGGGRQGDSGGE